MGKKERAKGRRGQREAIALLESYGYMVDELNSGKESADLIASIDLYCIEEWEHYLVEVKNCKLINIPKFLSQARKNAKAKKKKWMLMCKIDGGWGWLVMLQGRNKATIWLELDGRVSRPSRQTNKFTVG
jgi:hypothetical protein